ncbi:hypothetical protein AFIC_001257 [[Pseudomonas] carboxydohydrogena]|uniref:Uncharacterized protein n=2 Tax=Afipia carboxydohydrogena TaxID=290 RepID=A0ABY8BST5_AFICR|nr:hypothetical protein AFIC_001257 [[Pseudomonas] carboxydohydrogena]
MAQDDPAQLSDIRIESALPEENGAARQVAVEQHIRQALDADDPELADSFMSLARGKGIGVAPEVQERVRSLLAAHNSTQAVAGRFVHGLVTGEGNDGASLSGTLAGDLFVLGDVRDVLREGKRLAMGEDADRLVLGLASVGIAVTAATYVSVAGVAPLRAGLTLVKDARKVGRLGAGLTEWTGRAVRSAVDTPALTEAVQHASLMRPAQSVGALKAAFKAEKAGALVRLAKDTGRVSEKIGARGTLDVLRIADGPQDVARAARLVESKGKETRAIIKLIGRGALLLASGAFNLAWWVFAALIALVGFLASIKSTTERLTFAWLARRKRKKARDAIALAQATSA